MSWENDARVQGEEDDMTMRNRSMASLAAGLGLALLTAGRASALYYTNFDALAHSSSILVTNGPAGAWGGAAGASGIVQSNAYVYGGTTYSNAVIFSGEISNYFTRIAPEGGSNSVTIVLLAQMRWCDALPDSSVTTGKQAGLCVTTGGCPYAYGLSGWIALSNVAAGGSQSIASDQWVRLDFVLDYSGDYDTGNSNRVYYKTLIDTNAWIPALSSQRYKHASPFVQDPLGEFVRGAFLFNPATPGVNGISLVGEGVFDSPKVTGSGAGIPLAAAIDMRAYQAADGIYVEFTTTGESVEGGQIRLQAFDRNGNLVLDVTFDAQGGGSNGYRRKVSGLSRGERYTFVLTDEEGRPHRAENVEVGDFSAAMIRMTAPDGITIVWNSLPDHVYRVEWSLSPAGPSWDTVQTVTAVVDRTSAFVGFPARAAKGFFRIVME
jgi:hypothetical protein